tara:strand:+ start:3080 stop:5203 length:2124 start_codon:yes stop_codon:yes gene_type:complete
MAQNFNVEVEFKASGHAELEKAINGLVKAQRNLRNGQVAYNKTLTKSNSAIAHLEKRNKALTKSIVSTNNAFVVNQKTGAVVTKNTRLMSNTFATLRSQLLLISFGFGLVSASIGRFVKLQAEQELSEKKLSSALGFTSQSLLDYASSLQSVTSFGDEAIISAQALLAAFIKDEDQLKKATQATVDLAAAKGMDLTAAADLVGKSIGSSTNALSRYGIEIIGAVGSTTRLESATDSIAKLYGGQAAAQTLTLSGSMRQLSNTFGDFQEAIGSEFTDDIKVLVISLNLFLENLKENEEAIKKTAKAIKILAIVGISLLLPFGKIVKLIQFLGTRFATVRTATISWGNALKGLKSLLKTTGFWVLGLRGLTVKLGNAYETTSRELTNYQTILNKNIIGQKLLHDASLVAVADKREDITFTEKLIEAIKGLIEKRNKVIEDGKLQNQVNQETIAQEKLLQAQTLKLAEAKAKEGVTNKMVIAGIQAGVTVRDALMKATDGQIVLNEEFLTTLDLSKLKIEELTGFELAYAEALIATQAQLTTNKQLMEDDTQFKLQMQGLATLGQALQQFASKSKALTIVAIRLQQIAAVASAWKAFGTFNEDGKTLQAWAALAQGLMAADNIEKQLGKAKSAAFGTDFIADSPQFIKVGDNPQMRERVTVTPIGSPNVRGGGGGSEVVVNLNGNILGTEEFVRDTLIPQLENSLGRNLA